MIYVPVAVQALGFVLLLIATIFSWRHRNVASFSRVPALLLGSLVCVGIALAFMTAVLLQEKTGVKLGVSGGIASDARAWVRAHEAAPPKRNDVGANIKVLSDGVAFLKAHQAELPAAGKATLEELARVPAKPTRLLTVSEEAQYFQAADTAYKTIAEIAQQGSAAGK
jgi:hypothetical protein